MSRKIEFLSSRNANIAHSMVYDKDAAANMFMMSPLKAAGGDFSLDTAIRRDSEPLSAEELVRQMNNEYEQGLIMLYTVVSERVKWLEDKMSDVERVDIVLHWSGQFNDKGLDAYDVFLDFDTMTGVQVGKFEHFANDAGHGLYREKGRNPKSYTFNIGVAGFYDQGIVYEGAFLDFLASDSEKMTYGLESAVTDKGQKTNWLRNPEFDAELSDGKESVTLKGCLLSHLQVNKFSHIINSVIAVTKCSDIKIHDHALYRLSAGTQSTVDYYALHYDWGVSMPIRSLMALCLYNYGFTMNKMLGADEEVSTKEFKRDASYWVVSQWGDDKFDITKDYSINARGNKGVEIPPSSAPYASTVKSGHAVKMKSGKMDAQYYESYYESNCGTIKIGVVNEQLTAFQMVVALVDKMNDNAIQMCVTSLMKVLTDRKEELSSSDLDATTRAFLGKEVEDRKNILKSVKTASQLKKILDSWDEELSGYPVTKDEMQSGSEFYIEDIGTPYLCRAISRLQSYTLDEEFWDDMSDYIQIALMFIPYTTMLGPFVRRVGKGLVSKTAGILAKAKKFNNKQIQKMVAEIVPVIEKTPSFKAIEKRTPLMLNATKKINAIGAHLPLKMLKEGFATVPAVVDNVCRKGTVAVISGGNTSMALLRPVVESKAIIIKIAEKAVQGGKSNSKIYAGAIDGIEDAVLVSKGGIVTDYLKKAGSNFLKAQTPFGLITEGLSVTSFIFDDTIDSFLFDVFEGNERVNLPIVVTEDARGYNPNIRPNENGITDDSGGGGDINSVALMDDESDLKDALGSTAVYHVSLVNNGYKFNVTD